MEVGIKLGNKNIIESIFYTSSEILAPDVKAGFLSALEGLATDLTNGGYSEDSLASFKLICFSKIVKLPDDDNNTQPLISYAIMESDTDSHVIKGALNKILQDFLNMYSLQNIFSKKKKFFRDFEKSINQIFGDLSLKSEDKFKNNFQALEDDYGKKQGIQRIKKKESSYKGSGGKPRSKRKMSAEESPADFDSISEIKADEKEIGFEEGEGEEEEDLELSKVGLVEESEATLSPAEISAPKAPPPPGAPMPEPPRDAPAPPRPSPIVAKPEAPPPPGGSGGAPPGAPPAPASMPEEGERMRRRDSPTLPEPSPIITKKPEPKSKTYNINMGFQYYSVMMEQKSYLFYVYFSHKELKIMDEEGKTIYTTSLQITTTKKEPPALDLRIEGEGFEAHPLTGRVVIKKDFVNPPVMIFSVLAVKAKKDKKKKKKKSERRYLNVYVDFENKTVSHSVLAIIVQPKHYRLELGPIHLNIGKKTAMFISFMSALIATISMVFSVIAFETTPLIDIVGTFAPGLASVLFLVVFLVTLFKNGIYPLKQKWSALLNFDKGTGLIK